MRPSLLALTTLAALGCASTSGQLAQLDAEVRRLRSEQERQSALIEQLQHRVVLTEDAAHDARRALEASGRMATIRLGSDAAPARPDPIRVDSTTRPSAPEAPDDDAPRTTIRMGRGDRIPEQAPFAVREGDRLQVVPVAPLPQGATPPPSSSGSSRSAPPPAPAPTPSSSGPRSDLGPPAMAPLALGTGTLDPRAVDAYDAAFGLVRARRCDEAVEAFGAFLVRWPGHPHADNAMYWRGQCWLQRGETARGIAELEGLVTRFPVGNKIADALFTLASAYRRVGNLARAERTTQQLLTDHPDSDAARRLRDERQTP